MSSDPSDASELEDMPKKSQLDFLLEQLEQTIYQREEALNWRKKITEKNEAIYQIISTTREKIREGAVVLVREVEKMQRKDDGSEKSPELRQLEDAETMSTIINTQKLVNESEAVIAQTNIDLTRNRQELETADRLIDQLFEKEKHLQARIHELIANDKGSELENEEQQNDILE